MENRNSAFPGSPAPRARSKNLSFRARCWRGICSSENALQGKGSRSAADFPIFAFRISLFAILFVAGCASPGQPIERKAPVPAAVTDLAAEQSGNDVVLMFTLPHQTAEQQPLKQTPAIEIYRDFEPPANVPAAAPPAAPTLLATIPSGMIDRYARQGHIRYADSLTPNDFTQHPDSVVVYTVRTYVSAKKDSENSNAVRLRVFPSPDPVSDLKAEVTQSAVILTWSPPQKSPVPQAPAITGYRLYREDIGAAVPGAISKTQAAPAVIGEPDASSISFSDSNFEFGKTYAYLIRSVVQTPNGPLESGDSNRLVLTPKDIFPPAAPLGLVVTGVPAQGDTPAHAELSWAISPESDIAGYNVYRAEQPGASGVRLNNQLLLTPAFRDMNTQPGRRYFYTVTAVDRSGNESPMSAVVSGGAPAEGQASP